jgi:hypothetical protein
MSDTGGTIVVSRRLLDSRDDRRLSEGVGVDFVEVAFGWSRGRRSCGWAGSPGTASTRSTPGWLGWSDSHAAEG